MVLRQKVAEERKHSPVSDNRGEGCAVMSAATIIALLTSVITAPVLATMISYFKDRRKDKVAEDQLWCSAGSH